MMYPEFPSPEVLSKHKLGLVERTGGGPKLNCVTLSSPKAGTTAWDWMYCFSPTAPILRIAESFQGADQTVYNGIVSASGAFVGRDCSFSELGKVRVRVHLDSLEALPQMEESVFAPPPGAVEIPRRVNVRGTVMAAKLLRKVTPEYPAVAKAARIQGTVVLEAIIGKDGRVGDLRTLSGPTPFIQAATDAVRQWTYEPYLLDGEPVEVETHINVVFMLGLVPTM
jgi:TonB family protein